MSTFPFNAAMQNVPEENVFVSNIKASSVKVSDNNANYHNNALIGLLNKQFIKLFADVVKHYC